MHRNRAGPHRTVITIAEIADGIAKCRRDGASRKAARLSDWLETLLHLYSAQILPIDLEIARCIGRLSDVASREGHAPGLADPAIGATALCRGWTILTRNVRQVRPLGLAAHDPHDTSPADIA